MSNVNRLGIRNIQKVNDLEMDNFNDDNILYSLEEYLYRIEDIDFINQTLSKSKKIAQMVIIIYMMELF